MTSRQISLVFLLIACSACSRADDPPAATWHGQLETRIGAIDDKTPGEMGVYIKRLGDGSELDHAAGRRWYLSSTVKIPVAIAVLQAAQEKRLSLDEELTLREADFVDGAGNLIREPVGSRHRIASLIQQSIRDSDSVATDMLIRRLGEDELNRRIASWTSGFGEITTIQQVRYDVYGELHPKVAQLSAPQIAGLRRAAAGEARLQALLAALDVPRSELRLDSIDAAFERYYRGGKNSATLEAFAMLLEKLARGELLEEPYREQLLGHMRAITTGAKRIQAGLPQGIRFAQKTGTQFERACNMGLLQRGDDVEETVVVAACLEDFGPITQAESALQELGKAIGESGVLDAAKTSQ
jgi:beta-lactamase class A